MTRNEFIRDVNNWSDLIDFCWQNDLDITESVCSADERDEYINDNLRDMASNSDSWQGLLSFLESIPEGYDYYYSRPYGGWDGMDNDDLRAYKRDVIVYCDNNCLWEEEEQDENNDGEQNGEVRNEEEQEEQEEVDEELSTQPFSITELIAECAQQPGLKPSEPPDPFCLYF